MQYLQGWTKSARQEGIDCVCACVCVRKCVCEWIVTEDKCGHFTIPSLNLAEVENVFCVSMTIVIRMPSVPLQYV